LYPRSVTDPDKGDVVIDFTNARLVKLGEVPVATVEERAARLYVEMRNHCPRRRGRETK
jgi:hypothetical protein